MNRVKYGKKKITHILLTQGLVENFKCEHFLPIAGIHHNGSGSVTMCNEGTILAIYSHRLHTPIVIICEIKTLVCPVIGQTFRIIQI